MEPNTIRITFGNSVSPAHELQPLEAPSDAEQGLAQFAGVDVCSLSNPHASHDALTQSGRQNETHNKKPIDGRAYTVIEDLINRLVLPHLWLCTELMPDLPQARGGVARRRVGVSRD